VPLTTEEQNDYIQWAISHALAHWDPLELSASVMARRLACLCFAAIQSSVISITNTLFDVASSPHCASWLEAMRAEVLGEVQAAAGAAPAASSPWSKAGLARMTHVDSALRESMRLNGFVARGIMKMVVAPDGVRLPDGSHVPRGVKVGVQAYSVHRDGDIYADAERYDAFRFVAAPAAGGGAKGKPAAGAAPQALVTTSPTFLAFSHGPNAWCVLFPFPPRSCPAPTLTENTPQPRPLLRGQPAQADAGAHRHALRNRAHRAAARDEVVRGQHGSAHVGDAARPKAENRRVVMCIFVCKRAGPGDEVMGPRPGQNRPDPLSVKTPIMVRICAGRPRRSPSAVQPDSCVR